MKTETILDDEGIPVFSILEGHWGVDEFNHAFRREGFPATEPWPPDYISHEYWIKDEKGNWKPSHKNDPDSVPVTVSDWAGPQELTLENNPKLH